MGIRKTLVALSTWCIAHYAALIIGPISFIIGMLCAAPILGWHVSDNVVAAFGSAAGVVGTIGGAVWVIHVQSVKEAHAVSGAAGRFVIPFLRDLVSYGEAIALRDEPAEKQRLLDVTDSFAIALDRTRTRLSRLSDRIHTLDPTALENFVDIERFIDATHDQLGSIKQVIIGKEWIVGALNKRRAKIHEFAYLIGIFTFGLAPRAVLGEDGADELAKILMANDRHLAALKQDE